MTPRRAGPEDAATLARLNAHVQGWHAAHYPEAFFPNPAPQSLTAYFADRLSDPACTAFLTGDPATGYALCQLQTREASIFSPAIRRLMIDHIAVAPDARRHRGFTDDAEQADLAGRAGVRAATKFHGVSVQLPGFATNLNDADGIAVFVAEELHDVGAALDVGVFHFGPGNGHVLLDRAVDHVLHHGDLLGS